MFVKSLIPLLLCLVCLAGQLWVTRPKHQPAQLIFRAPPLSESFERYAGTLSDYEDVRVELLSQANRRYTQLVRIEQRRAKLARDPKPVMVEMISAYNGSLSEARAQYLAAAIEDSCRRHEVDPFLVTALISKESRFHPEVVSPGGAVGLGQLLPGTARELGVDCWDPAQNIEGCTKYLARQLRTWQRRQDPVALALASYNAGPGRVHQYGGVPPFAITRDYVVVIKSRYAGLKEKARERALGIANAPISNSAL